MADRRYTCPWCDNTGSGEELSCPACGAPIDVQNVVTRSGWSELPAVRDMARIEMGRSSCQISGAYVPVADMNLAEGDGVYFTHHVLLWKEPRVQITVKPLKSAWKALFAGMPLVMTQAHGPGHIAFSRDHPGELIALPLHPGHAVDVREHVFVLATNNVTYDWVSTNIWFTTRSGNERETHRPMGAFMDRFTVSKDPGLLIVHGGGNVFVRKLEPGQHVLVKPTALLFKDKTVQMQLHFEHPSGTWRSWRSWGERYLWLRLEGPGRVAVQSAYAHMHDPGNALVNSSPATVRRW